MAPFTIGDKPLDIATIEQISRQHRPVTLGGNARQRMAQAQQVVVDILSQPAPKPTYGINTGFGALADVSVKRSDLDALQLNLIRSHCTGVGEPLPTEATRALMLLRGAVLAKGRSGARPRLADLLCEFLNRGIHPVIPSRGSVGASGDLAPLAHLALSLIGEGTVEYQGQVRPSREVLDECNITPLTLQPKEGLTLINGTQLMAGLGSLTLADAQALCLAADVIGAMSLDGLLGTWAAFDERVVSARPHAGQVACGKRLISLLADSPIGTSHEDCGKVQDPYSLRCMPQVHGATADALAHCESVLVTEANSCTDNPLVFSEDGAIISGGNFHGQPVALALDYAAIATAELANISERRIEQLVNPHLSSGLPPFLTKHSGLQSGFMMAQVSAAALVSENKILCHPSSVDSIPSSASREDHVSMGATGALKFAQIVDHVTTVLAIELLCSAQAIDLRAPLKTSEPLQKVHKLVRQRIPALEEDRVLSGDIAAAKELVASRQLQQAALS